MADSPRCALVLLAAGASRRMGGPKQLLPVGGKPLLRLVAETALLAPVAPVVVVLGAEAAAIRPVLDGLAVQVVVNETWAEGMGSSLRAGVQAAESASPAIDAVIIALADQPDCAPKNYAALIATWQKTGRGIVASGVEDVLQPPVLFDRSWFSRLLALTGDAGARQLLAQHRSEAAIVPLAAGADLDTPADYEQFRRRTET